MLTKLSLFSGIGGDDLASDWAGIKTAAFVERDKYCQQVLAKHWPGIPIIGDVHDVTKAKVMAYTERDRLQRGGQERNTPGQVGLCDRTGADEISDICNAEHKQFDGHRETQRGWRQPTDANWWTVEPNVGRVAHGVPHRVDRLKALGNAVVPQQIYPVYKAIADIENAALVKAILGGKG